MMKDRTALASSVKNSYQIDNFPFAFSPIGYHNENMTIRNFKPIEKAIKRHAASRKPLTEWLEVATNATWNNIMEARAIFPTMDFIRGTNLTCVNIGGNSFRLIIVISYSAQEIVIQELLTHAEYNKKYVR